MGHPRVEYVWTLLKRRYNGDICIGYSTINSVGLPPPVALYSLLTGLSSCTWFTRDRVIWLCRGDDSSAGPRTPDSNMNSVELLCPIGFLCLISGGRDVKAVWDAASPQEGSKPTGYRCLAISGCTASINSAV